MRDDPFLTWITVAISLSCLVLVSVLAVSGALGQALPLGLCAGITACVAGLWTGLWRTQICARRAQQSRLPAIERLVGALHEGPLD